MTDQGAPLSELFDETIDLPNGRAAERLEELIGLDEAAEQMTKELLLVLQRDALEEWSRLHHDGVVLPAIASIAQRPPLIILAGEVGCGKTSLAETFADPVARLREAHIHVLRLSLRVRGRGAVGEMTNLITSAFDEVARIAQPYRSQSPARGAAILIVDEGDAVAQSRDLMDMHHEDRAGVNALIRGIAQLAERRLPAMVVLCTNRLDSLDPALRRRAAREIPFARPDEDQRLALLRRDLRGAGLDELALRTLARLTGSTAERDYGYTYSDLRERLIPAAILSVYPNDPLSLEVLERTCTAMAPSPRFNGTRPK